MNLKTLIEQLELIKQQAELSKGPQYAKAEGLEVLYVQSPIRKVQRVGNKVILLPKVHEEIHTN